jgi:FtsZ-binding cell division protein ZapB
MAEGQIMNKLIPIIVLTLASGAWAQTTKPTTKPASFWGTYQQMQDEINALRAEVDRLKMENAALKARVTTAAATRPALKMTRQALNFEPGMYQIYLLAGRGAAFTWRCETLDDALRAAKNKRWPIQIDDDPEDGSPSYPGIVRIGD